MSSSGHYSSRNKKSKNQRSDRSDQPRRPPDDPSRPREEWSSWGEWVWSRGYKRYYRQRQDINGNVETMWATEHNSTPTTREEYREEYREDYREEDRDEEVEGVADRLGDFTIKEQDEEDDQGDYQDNYVASGGRPSGKPPKGKGKSTRKKEDRGGDDDYNRRYAQDTGAGYDTRYTQSTGYADQEQEEEYNYEEDQDAYYEEDISKGKAASREHQHRHRKGGESSKQQESSSKSRRGQTQDYEEYYEPNYDPPYDQGGGGGGGGGSEGGETPRGAGGLYDIQGDEGEPYEPLDPRYRLEPSHRFQPGEVFKVLWPEPKGSGVGGTPTISDTQKVKTKHGENFYIGFRRFVVVANDQGHCQCVPILTYGGRGLSKRGVKADRHGVVYDYRYKGVKLLPDEPKPGFPSVRLIIEVEGEKLAKESRINYSKIVTVEHNVKVFFIGHIYPDDYQLVSDAVNRCWERKVTDRKKRQR